MAHYEKYHQSDVIGLLYHDNRQLKTERENIDESRSHLNYNLHNIENEYEFYKNRLEFVKNNGGIVRDNSVVMCSFIVTLPKTFPQNEELEKQFFNACYNLICDDFGKENVISAWCHYDESQPHIHLKILPVQEKIKTYANGDKKNRLSLNANRMIDKNYLQKFHNRLDEYIEDYIGFKTDVVNGATKYGHQTVEELKAITEAKEELEKIKNSYSLSEKENELFNLKEKEIQRKKLVNDFWKEYQEISKNYWSNYKIVKQNIKNDIFEIKRNVKSAEDQLLKDLNFFYNLRYGLLFALIRLFNAMLVYFVRDELNANLKRLEGELEELDKQRRSISNYQNSSKNALKSQDLDKIELSLKKWEDSVMMSEELINKYLSSKSSIGKLLINKNKEKEEERF